MFATIDQIIRAQQTDDTDTQQINLHMTRQMSAVRVARLTRVPRRRVFPSFGTWINALTSAAAAGAVFGFMISMHAVSVAAPTQVPTTAPHAPSIVRTASTPVQTAHSTPIVRRTSHSTVRTGSTPTATHKTGTVPTVTVTTAPVPSSTATSSVPAAPMSTPSVPVTPPTTGPVTTPTPTMLG